MREEGSRDYDVLPRKRFLPQSEPLALGLCYGPLIKRINRIAMAGQMPLALIIRGPGGVGKRTLCRFLAAQVLGIHPWLRDIVYVLGTEKLQVQVRDFPKNSVYDSPNFFSGGHVQAGHTPGSGLFSGFPSGDPQGDSGGGTGSENGGGNTLLGSDQGAHSGQIPANHHGQGGLFSGFPPGDPQGDSGGGTGGENGGGNTLLGSDQGAYSGQIPANHHGQGGLLSGFPSGDPQGDSGGGTGSENGGGTRSDSANAYQLFGQQSGAVDFGLLQQSSGDGSGVDYAGPHARGGVSDIALLNQRWVQDKGRLESHPEYISMPVDPGMEEIRTLRQKLGHTRHNQSSWRIVVLPEAQLLRTNTTNALLKLIENPPPRTLFLLTTTGSLSKTLASRCTSYTMAPLDSGDFTRLVDHAFGASGEKNDRPSCDPSFSTAREEPAQSVLPDAFCEKLFFKMVQGCLGRMPYWQERMGFVKEGWDLFHRCALGDCTIDQDWLKTAITMGQRLWELVYIWARDMYSWAYEENFLWHWDGFWESTWNLVREHEIYHTDTTFLLHTVCARIQGFFAYYGVRPMPLVGGEATSID
jgi:DNA polymerase III delta prime subunit